MDIKAVVVHKEKDEISIRPRRVAGMLDSVEYVDEDLLEILKGVAVPRLIFEGDDIQSVLAVTGFDNVHVFFLDDGKRLLEHYLAVNGTEHSVECFLHTQNGDRADFTVVDVLRLSDFVV